MFASIKIAAVIVVLATGGVGYLYVTKLQSDVETARANVAKMEVAVQTAEASIKTLQEDTQRLNELNQGLQNNLQRAEEYGDDLRLKLQRHNLTARALKNPADLEGSMNGATAKLWRELEQDTGGSGNAPLPNWLQSGDSRTESSDGDGDTEDDNSDSSTSKTD
jgi:outer membrane murein-binding lipoprotein Lpp